MARMDKMYNDSPRLERDKDSGDMGIKKPSQADAEDMGTDGDQIPGAGDGMKVNVHQLGEIHDMHGRHQEEHMKAHHRHMMEHYGHKGGDKSEMTKRHEKELKDMHERHDKETSSVHKRHMSAGETASGGEGKKE